MRCYFPFLCQFAASRALRCSAVAAELATCHQAWLKLPSPWICFVPSFRQGLGGAGLLPPWTAGALGTEGTWWLLAHGAGLLRQLSLLPPRVCLRGYACMQAHLPNTGMDGSDLLVGCAELVDINAGWYLLCCGSWAKLLPAPCSLRSPLYLLLRAASAISATPAFSHHSTPPPGVGTAEGGRHMT